MRIIAEGNTRVSRLLGKQLLKDVEYRIMRYVLRTECEDGTLLLNVITGEMVLISADEAQLLDYLPAHQANKLGALIEHYFLVPVDYDEYVTVKKIRKLMRRLFAPRGINHYVIFPTTHCNARCFYCFESDYARLQMDEDTANQLIKYMLEHKKEDVLKISWFGGEPLVGLVRIRQICDALRERKVKFTSRMTSNGYLFTEELAEIAAKEWNLKNIQITLDGTETIYNKTKSYISVKDNPYDRVMRNIQFLMDQGVVVEVRLNLTKENVVDLRNLAYELAQKFPDHSKMHVYVHVVFGNVGYEPIVQCDDETLSLYQKQVELSEYLEQLGLVKHNDKLPCIKYVNCMADDVGSRVVYPDGSLFKCETVNLEEKIGDIHSDTVNMAAFNLYQDFTEKNACDKCPICPKCLLVKQCTGLEWYNKYTCEYQIKQLKNDMKKRYWDCKKG